MTRYPDDVRNSAKKQFDLLCVKQRAEGLTGDEANLKCLFVCEFGFAEEKEEEPKKYNGGDYPYGY